jgi:gliding-associated putative ABC transporter substrate-binding component GldG
VTIRIFLQGELPSGFKKLSVSTQELLQEFREYGGNNVEFRFEEIGAGLESDAKAIFLDSMARLGLKPYTINVQLKKESEEMHTVVPGALLEYKGLVRAINLLSGQNSSTLDEAAINSTEALLEFKFADAIQKLTRPKVPVMAYLLGNGETDNEQISSLDRTILRPNFQVGYLQLDEVPVIPTVIDAVIILKPTKPFSDAQKLKIDQYIMHGGKVIWMVDRLYAEMDSLLRSQGDFVAYDRNLNLEDQLFKYGVRINPELVQDLQCDQFPLVVGSVGDKPQMQLVDWPYFPLLEPYNRHPISRNLNKVRSLFPNAIDTINTPGIHKTVLLTSSTHARKLGTPALVSLNSVKTEDDIQSFNQQEIPVAVLLEGVFPSLYANRLSGATVDSLLGGGPYRFLSQSGENKMIVMSDADIATNAVTRQGPQDVGVNPFTGVQYANKDFLLNCLEYLVDPSGILETRSKDFTLRLLDPQKIEEEKTFWQTVTIGLPVLIMVGFGLVFQWLRRRRFTRPASSFKQG